MPTTRAKTRLQAANVAEQNEGQSKQQQGTSLHITELPQPVLELILIPGTSTMDKKTLRLTCKLFQQALDESMVCISKRYTQQDQRTHWLQRLVNRVQNVHSLKVVVPAVSLLNVLPEQLTSAVIVAPDVVLDLECLRRFPRLTALSIRTAQVTGFQHITGLTSLHCPYYRGCLAHLATTLKQLEVHDCTNIEDLHKLTNLEVLKMSNKMPANFFQQHRKLPLKHLYLDWLCNQSWLKDATAWQAAPTSLTRLTIVFPCDFLPGVLPTSINHLQLVHPNMRVIEQKAASLPGVQILDVCLYSLLKRSTNMFDNLDQFNEVQSLGICIKHCQDADVNVNRHRGQVMSVFPEVARAVANGVKLRVFEDVNELLGVFSSPEVAKSEWATGFRE